MRNAQFQNHIFALGGGYRQQFIVGWISVRAIQIQEKNVDQPGGFIQITLRYSKYYNTKNMNISLTLA